MKILYLYSEVMGYTLSTIKHLSNLNNDVHVVHWDSKGKRTPYKFDRDKKIKFYSRSKLNFKKLYNLYLEIKPNIIVNLAANTNLDMLEENFNICIRD